MVSAALVVRAGLVVPVALVSADADRLAAEVIGLLIARGETVAVAESLTGGLVTAELTTVPGSSAAVRGGVVAYAAEVKASQLGVPSELLDRYGTVHRDVAVAMARGARDRLGATIGLAATGVAGPDPVEGHPVGTVHIAVCGGPDSGSGSDFGSGSGSVVRHEVLALSGDREQIRGQTVERVLRLLAAVLTE